MFRKVIMSSINVNSLPPEKYFIFFVLSANFFQIHFFEKFFQEYHQSVK